MILDTSSTGTHVNQSAEQVNSESSASVDPESFNYTQVGVVYVTVFGARFYRERFRK